MSEFHVIVVEIGKVGHHPNADSLDITQVFGYPCITRRDQFKPGDLAVYIPVDAMVPLERPEFAFLRKNPEDTGYQRIKAKKLRGIFSMGLLINLPDKPFDICAHNVIDLRGKCTWLVGTNLQEFLGIKKYEPPIEVNTGGMNEYCPFDFPKYTDIEGWRRYPDIIKMGEEVVVTEKIHGCNARFLYKEGRLWVGSHNHVKANTPPFLSKNNLWWTVAEQLKLEEKLKIQCDTVFFGEIYGQVQKGFHYDKSPEQPLKIRIFDMFDLRTIKYFDWDIVEDICPNDIGLPLVPILYRGPLTPDVLELRNGKSTLNPETIREGIVIKPIVERYDTTIGRVILKFVSEDFLLSKLS